MAKKIGWLVTDDGFQKSELLEDNEAFRKIKMIGGASDGTESIIPAAGMPNGDLYPCFYEGDEEPKVWRFKGRTLPIVDLSKFKNPEQAKLLVPEEEPYMFLPHTTQVIDGVIAGDHQLLFGPTGVGKTSILTNIAARIMQPTLRVNFTGQVSISDVVGSIGIVNGSTVWNDGPLPRAMRNGYWLICDEFDFGDPSVLSIFYPVLEARPKLCLKEHDGEIIEAHPNFRIFATGNSIGGGDKDGEYVGTQPLNAALLNRFSGHGSVIHVQPMKSKQEREVLSKRMPSMPARLIKRFCDMASKLRNGDGQNPPMIPTFSTRELINWGHKAMLYRDAIKAANITFLPLVKDINTRKGIEDAIQAVFGKRIIIGKMTIQGTDADGAPTTIVAPGKGRVSAQVTDKAEMKAIYDAKQAGLSFEQIEKDEKFNLRESNGMTAWRICKRYREALQREAAGVTKADDKKADEAPKAPKAKKKDDDEDEEEPDEDEEEEEEEEEEEA